MFRVYRVRSCSCGSARRMCAQDVSGGPPVAFGNHGGQDVQPLLVVLTTLRYKLERAEPKFVSERLLGKTHHPGRRFVDRPVGPHRGLFHRPG